MDDQKPGPPLEMIPSLQRHYARRFNVDPDQLTYAQKVTMMAAYIRDRYGSPERAGRFWRSHGWYQGHGHTGDPP